MAMVAFSAAEENVIWMDEYLQHHDDNVCTKVTKFAKEYIRVSFRNLPPS